MKIHELAKELGVQSKTVVDFLVKEGADVKNHMSTVPENMIDKTKEAFNRKAEEKISPGKKPGVKAIAVPEFLSKMLDKEKKKEKEKEKEVKASENNAVKKEKTETVKENNSDVAPDKAEASVETAKDTTPAKEEIKEQNSAETVVPKSADTVKETIKASEPVKAAEPKAEVNPEPKAEVKPEPKAEVKPENKAEVKPEAKAEAKPVKQEEPKKHVQKKRIPARDRIPDDELKAQREKKTDNKKEKFQPGTKVNFKKEQKPKESEAAKSLREKLVKGKVSVDAIPASSNNRQNDNGRRQGRDRNNDRNNDRGNDRNNDRKPFERKPFNKNQNDNRNQGQAAPQMPSNDKNRGGKGKHNKYDKNKKGDKFDRLENEKAAQKIVKQQVKEEVEEVIKVIELPETISIKDFAAKLKLQPSALIKKLFLQGKIYTVNDIIDFETAEEIALEYDIISEHEVVIDYIEELLKEEDDPEESLVKRPPVVCVMGHVDHGKTSLLDAIRKTNVISGEAGGITQHIGAYTVVLPSGEKLTFLDTPGHEAFTAMRLRGAQSTDVAILVVAADDGVMPQTIEAINHAKAANIHVIVAINKIDKPGANIDKVKTELAEQGLTPEDWGGDTIFVPISAKQGIGIEELLEMVILDTEILELRANPNRMARGIVIEAKLDKGRGTVATLLVQKGTLKVGDHIAMGEAYGKVRAMINDKGERIKTAGPSTPVEITGLSAVPNAGDTFVAFDNDKDAKNFASVFIEENKKKLLAGTKHKMSLDDVFDQMKTGELKELDIIIKADVQGSAEAMKDSLEKLSNDEVLVKVIHAGVGNVSESDAVLASASNAIIIAFNVSVNADARMTIEHEKIDLRNYKVIYNAIDDVELAMKGMLEPIYEEVITGHVEVRQTFKASGVGIIAGSYVLDGLIKKNSKIRLSRDDEQIYEGSVASLKRFSDDAKEVKAGFECGVVLDDFTDIREGDIMEAYEMKEVARV